MNKTSNVEEMEEKTEEKVEDKNEPNISQVKDWIEDVLIQMNNTGVVPHRQIELFAENLSFNYQQALERVREWASTDGSGDEDKINWAKFRRAFAWFDPRDPKLIKSYKMLHHDVDLETGELKTVWRGVAESMILFLGAKGNVDIPAHEKSAVYNHLARHYGEFGKTVPDFKTYTEEEIADLEPENDFTDEDIAKLAKEVIVLLKQNGYLDEVKP